MIHRDKAWKLSTLGLGIACVALWVRGPEVPEERWTSADDTIAHRAQTRPAARLHRPFRIPARALGVSEDALVSAISDSKQWSERNRLCQKLSVVASDRSVPALEEWLERSDRQLRSCAIEVLGAIGSPLASDVLIATATARPSLRSSVLTALGHIDRPEAQSYVESAALDPRDRDRPSAIDGLGHSTSQRSFEILVGLADEPEQMIAMAVLGAAQERPAAEAQELYRLLAKSPNRHIRASAIGLMTEVSEEELLALASEGDPYSGSSAIQALGRMDTPAATAALITLASEGNQFTRTTALTALGERGDEDAIATLFEHLWRGGSMGSVAGQALAEHAERGEVREQLLAAATAAGPQAEGALYALSSQRGPDIDAVMLELAKRGSPSMKNQALNYLVMTRHPDVPHVLAAEARSGSRQSRTMSVYLLGQVGGERARKELTAIAREDSELGREALQALVQYGGGNAEVEDIVLRRVEDGDTSMTSVHALLNLGSERAKSKIVELLRSEDDDVALSVIASIPTHEASGEVLDTLTELARSGKGELGTRALQQLAMADPQTAVSILASAQNDDPQAFARRLSSFSGVGGDELGGLLRDAANSDSTEVRAAVAQTAAHSGDASLGEVLGRLARDSDDSVRDSALRGLLQLDPEAGAKTIREMASSRSAEERASAARSVSELGEGDDLLATLVGDRNPEVVRAALSSYAPGASRTARAALLALVSDASRPDDLRRIAAYNLKNERKLSAEERAQVEAVLAGPAPGL